MSRHQLDECAVRLSTVLADVEFPTTKWQLVVHAEFIGADIRSRTELYRLPARRYEDLASVITTVKRHRAGDDE